MMLSSVNLNGGRIGAWSPQGHDVSHAVGFLYAGIGLPVAVNRSRRDVAVAIRQSYYRYLIRSGLVKSKLNVVTFYQDRENGVFIYT
jgi:hypothetical protein